MRGHTVHSPALPSRPRSYVRGPADRAVKAGVVQRFHDLIHIEAAVRGKVCGLLEILLAVEFQIADVSEVDAAL